MPEGIQAGCLLLFWDKYVVPAATAGESYAQLIRKLEAVVQQNVSGSKVFNGVNITSFKATNQQAKKKSG